ncbi:hypothetical protein LH51_07715 [Nitrincola sp. A-D6]|uniref:ATP-binding protein n=1 Tax=Nitrincola sp. A-D6 TaxID=1545442 RepID=UPI00051FD6AC|nr:ATP-binding protein [Nitrincola sp. A-D6]KGK42395.1 hypothetical protein LH51_07715 [Nitrincola sp. A-D6]
MRQLLPRSLKSRLFLASLVVLPLIIVAAVMILQRAHYDSLVASERSQAQLQVYLLLGLAELDGGELKLPELLPEPGFSQTGSGVYAFISNDREQLLWQSDSSTLLPAAQVTEVLGSIPSPGQVPFRYLADSNLYLLQYPIIWEGPGEERFFMISVLRSDERLREQMRAFSARLWGSLMGVLVLALSMQYLILRWGLRPLGRLAADLRHIEKGESDSLSGSYPREVQPVTENLNQLILTERQQRERYRNTLADLAHSLKTPLAVITGASSENLSPEAYRKLVEEQSQRMDQIVQYQLSRAVKSKGGLAAKPVLVRALVQRVADVLIKVYTEKSIQIDNRVEDNAQFYGDERDLMELLGNLMENACKYGLARVQVTSSSVRSGLLLLVEDDGPGVLPTQSKVILERGQRIDRSISGQGIGLAVVVDILSSYDGALEVDSSPELKGARFRMLLPIPT